MAGLGALPGTDSGLNGGQLTVLATSGSLLGSYDLFLIVSGVSDAFTWSWAFTLALLSLRCVLFGHCLCNDFVAWWLIEMTRWEPW